MQTLEARYHAAIQGAQKDPVSKAILELLIEREPHDPPMFGAIELTLFHGTPEHMIDTMLQRLNPQEHNILGGDWLCVSPNDNVLRYFGDGSTSGFSADNVPLKNCVFITDWHLDLMLSLATDEGTKCSKFEDWFESRGINYWSLDTDDLAHAWKYLPEEIEAFIWPDCHKYLVANYGWAGQYNHEAEISLTNAGCRVFEKHISQIIRFGDWQEKPNVIQLTFPQLRCA